jgi:hypothetical protein
VVGFLRYGWRDPKLWSLVSMGVIYYGVIVFPYSQYVRDNGGRQGAFEQRAEVTKDAFLRIAGDSSFRSSVTDRVSKGSYFGPGSLSPFNRLAMVGEADRLIAATERQRAYTGWETITWGFKLATPSFLYPKKPIFEAGNYLGHIVGEVGSSDSVTQLSYGGDGESIQCLFLRRRFGRYANLFRDVLLLDQDIPWKRKVGAPTDSFNVVVLVVHSVVPPQHRRILFVRNHRFSIISGAPCSSVYSVPNSVFCFPG